MSVRVFGPKKQLIAAQSRLGEVLCLKRRADALLSEQHGVDCVMAPPRAIVVVEVVIWICCVNPQDNFR